MMKEDYTEDGVVVTSHSGYQAVTHGCAVYRNRDNGPSEINTATIDERETTPIVLVQPNRRTGFYSKRLYTIRRELSIFLSKLSVRGCCSRLPVKHILIFLFILVLLATVVVLAHVLRTSKSPDRSRRTFYWLAQRKWCLVTNMTNFQLHSFPLVKDTVLNTINEPAPIMVDAPLLPGWSLSNLTEDKTYFLPPDNKAIRNCLMNSLETYVIDNQPSSNLDAVSKNDNSFDNIPRNDTILLYSYGVGNYSGMGMEFIITSIISLDHFMNTSISSG
ncbi:hypothetical protein CHS0354_021603 [Potamilus streckersoni]|uniref:Uncharacterized protein n=1 Tax=Potamilus streckersoni TaxID=2493646 RepID=A0AAE0SPP1_9BIVA|nr:hypothetical protein CHS0354_021603 [Potamilus streckersoni]